jgi:hypothetical protein
MRVILRSAARTVCFATGVIVTIDPTWASWPALSEYSLSGT